MPKSSLGILADNWGAMQPSIREQLWATLSGERRDSLRALWPDVELATPPDAQKQPVAKENPKHAKLPTKRQQTPITQALAPIPEMPDPQDWDDGLDIDLGDCSGHPNAPKQLGQTVRPRADEGSTVATAQQRTYLATPTKANTPKLYLKPQQVAKPQQMPQTIEVLQPIMQQLRLMEAQIAELRGAIAKPSLRADILICLGGRPNGVEPWQLATLSDCSRYRAFYGPDQFERVQGDILVELNKLRFESVIKWRGGTTDKVKLRSMK